LSKSLYVAQQCCENEFFRIGYIMLRLSLLRIDESPVLVIQTGKTALLKTLDSILNGAQTVSPKARYFITGLACAHQQHDMRTAVVARSFISADLLLKSPFRHSLGILYLKPAHGMLP
jgi:hypothetical protein